MTCNELPREDLVAWIDDELHADASAHVSAHVASCAACADDADLLRRAGDLVAALPRVEPSADFVDRVVSSARGSAAPAGRLHRMWPALAAAAAAVLLVALLLGPDGTGPRDATDDTTLTAREERQIAEDLLVLGNLDALESTDPDELIEIVEVLDLLEGLEPEVTGAFADDGEEGG